MLNKEQLKKLLEQRRPKPDPDPEGYNKRKVTSRLTSNIDRIIELANATKESANEGEFVKRLERLERFVYNFLTREFGY